MANSGKPFPTMPEFRTNCIGLVGKWVFLDLHPLFFAQASQGSVNHRVGLNFTDSGVGLYWDKSGSCRCMEASMFSLPVHSARSGGEPWTVCTFAAEANFRLLLLKTEVVGLERYL